VKRPADGELVPPPGTVERWAYDYVATDALAHKLAPPPVPDTWEDAPPARRVDRPGRPAELVVVAKAPKRPGPEALRDPLRRAERVHTFLHHELQAAELMAFALLAFPDTPRAWKRGLVGVLLDEVRHMADYARHLDALGSRVGAFPVRDWFWQRVPAARSPVEFAAVMGMGFEAGNLDHTARFAERFRAIGDEEGARIQEKVCFEEIPHVRFALAWFERWTGGRDYDAWRRCLPPPLSPLVMKGDPLNWDDRAKAGFPEVFSREVAAYRDEKEPPR
jgi:uncharacterized ferritin-like protein (DUF455 family)